MPSNHDVKRKRVPCVANIRSEKIRQITWISMVSFGSFDLTITNTLLCLAITRQTEKPKLALIAGDVQAPVLLYSSNILLFLAGIINCSAQIGASP